MHGNDRHLLYPIIFDFPPGRPEFQVVHMSIYIAHLSENTFDGSISMLFPKVGNMLFWIYALCWLRERIVLWILLWILGSGRCEH